MKIRVLHTADWHIGHRLHDNERYEEHQLFLDWLLDTIENQQIDVLIVAGDIFDNGYPSHEAQLQYYQFLRGLAQTRCYNSVIVGGNHDYPGTLNAPRDILALLNIKVIGKAFKDPSSQIIPIYDKQKQMQALVCAVPFLRDRDIREAVAGESYEQIEERIREGIIKHYQVLAEAVSEVRQPHIPILATGHLFTQGGEPSDPAESRECSEKPIHIGTLGNVSAQDFPPIFDYIALGHLHRTQMVNKQTHIRYSGSPIPLSFSEFSDKKNVLVIEFEDNKMSQVIPVPVPSWRKLVRFKGSLEAIDKAIQAFDDSQELMRIWAEVRIELDHYDPNVVQKVQEMVKDRRIDVLKHRVIYTQAHRSLDEQIGTEKSLHDLTPEEVFLRKCESENLHQDQYPEMLQAFRELLEGLPLAPS